MPDELIPESIIAIVLAFALTEAFKQFRTDTPKTASEPFVNWDRLPALVAFLLLLIPFYQGIGQYFHKAYHGNQRPESYGMFLLVDYAMFTIEAALFVLSTRVLPLVQWRRFYTTVVCILIVDTLWGSFVWLTHSHDSTIQYWLILNVIFLALFTGILVRPLKGFRPTPYIGLLLMVIRTVADYCVSWHVYFPSKP